MAEQSGKSSEEIKFSKPHFWARRKIAHFRCKSPPALTANSGPGYQKRRRARLSARGRSRQ